MLYFKAVARPWHLKPNIKILSNSGMTLMIVDVPDNEVKMVCDRYNISAGPSILPYRRRHRRDLLHCHLSKMVTLSHQRRILRKAFKILLFVLSSLFSAPQAIVDLILYYDWKSVIYIYQSSEESFSNQIYKLTCIVPHICCFNS